MRPSFFRARAGSAGGSALYPSAREKNAFDLLELDGKDLRREPIETRKATLASLLRGSRAGLRLKGNFEYSGDVVFRLASALPSEANLNR